MRPPPQREAVGEVAERLTELLGLPRGSLRLHRRKPRGDRAPEADAIVETPDHIFVVAYKTSGATGPVLAAARQARRFASHRGPNAVPVVAVPYMGEVGRRRCEEAHVAWLDLSGNASIVVPGVRIVIEGRPNRFKQRGRPANAFAPKSARITRWLLEHPSTPVTQQEVSEATGVDPGFTSRIVSRLEQDELIVRDEAGAIRPRDPGALLDAWQERYDFFKHRVYEGHIPARDGPELLRRLAAELATVGAYAATGLAGAWLLTGFAGFRLVTLYMSRSPSAELRKQIRFREGSSGPNVWLVVPDDEGVFQGSSDRDGVRCVHPVQVYLDLKSQPERSEEAAGHLRAEVLGLGVA